MKQIPILLKSHLQQAATTWCLLLRIKCVGRWDGIVLGFTNLDAALTYDDGDGVVVYSPDNGFAPERIQAAADFSVDNTDLVGWVSDAGITDQQIAAGLFDFAEVTVYRVNYMDLLQGHEVVLFGTCGQTKFSETSWRTEFRSLMQQAKQTISNVYSLTCRATYGDKRCGMPFEWHEATVTAQGADTLRMFVASGLPQADGVFDLGVVRWLTGNNAGAEMEVDEFLAGGIVRLSLPEAFVISEGDTFMIREDCEKTFEACKKKGNVLNFRGEHLTPVAQTGLSVPGAYVKSVGSS